MSAFWFFSLGVFTCLWLPVELTSIRDSQIDLSTPNCKELLCEQANEQAKGLSKLALLDEFVSQTVFLLNDLMKNIDGELDKSANSLLRYVHPHCEPTRAILQEVIEKQKEKLKKGSKSLSHGVDPHPEEDSTEIPQISVFYDGQHQDEDDDNMFQGSWESKYVEDQNNRESEYHSTQSPWVNRDHGDQNPRGGKDHGKDYEQSKVFKPSPLYSPSDNGREFDKSGRGSQRKRSDRHSKHSWRGSNKSFHGTGQDKEDSDDSDWIERSSESSGSRKHHGKTVTKEFSSSTACKGVERGNAFWVPGLDQWCQENCSNGYCPKTHCTC